MKLRVRTPLRALVLGGTCAFMVAGAAATGLAADTAARAGTITLYSGQHEQTVSKLVADFDEAHRHQGQGALGRRGDAGQPDHPGGLEARRPTSSSPRTRRPCRCCRRRASSPPWLRPRWPRCRAPQRAVGRLGRDLRPCRGARLQHGQAHEGRPAEVADRPRLARPGRVSFAIAPGETDFQPLITSIAKVRGKARRARLARRPSRATRRCYEDNELIAAAVNKGTVEAGLVDHYYWYRLRDEVGADNTHSALHYFAPHDPGMLVDVSARRGPEAPARTRPTPSASSPTW